MAQNDGAGVINGVQGNLHSNLHKMIMPSILSEAFNFLPFVPKPVLCLRKVQQQQQQQVVHFYPSCHGKSYGFTTISVHSGVSFVGVGYHIHYDRYGRQQAKSQLWGDGCANQYNVVPIFLSVSWFCFFLVCRWSALVQSFSSAYNPPTGLLIPAGGGQRSRWAEVGGCEKWETTYSGT